MYRSGIRVRSQSSGRAADVFFCARAPVIPQAVYPVAVLNRCRFIAGIFIPASGRRHDKRVFRYSLPVIDPIAGACGAYAGGIDIAITDVKHQVSVFFPQDITGPDTVLFIFVFRSAPENGIPSVLFLMDAVM